MQGNLGLAMIVMAAVFLGAAIYRKKFLDLIFDTIKKGNASINNKFDTQKIVNTSKAMARRIGVTDVVSDWWFSRARGRRNNNTGKTESEPLEPEVFGPEQQKKTQADAKGYINQSATWNATYTVMDDDTPEEQKYKQLPDGGKKDYNSCQTPGEHKNIRQNGKESTPDTGSSLDTTRAVPPGIKGKNNKMDNPEF